ncbi:hypothetical protein FA95DRAFT_1583555 [Auriscalpium vulgare]|uniref:Uncharacterized protein n=1 Tax=Auriscalpium vulgare TaxID=40419 RepID=A0ACB8RM69_9AGAM|nr:hypothetical protein FA95DRAFT_1583555 [Auriscalpium vulgare]
MPPPPLSFHYRDGLDSSRPSPTSSLYSLVDLVHPRKPRLRATLLCLFTLVGITTYIFLVAQPSLTAAPISLRKSAAPVEEPANSWRLLAANYAAKYRNVAAAVVASHPEVELTPAQELGAVTSFMVALPQNVIPLTVDPSRPIDPQLVLDFDTRSSRAEAEVEDLVADVWARNPVVLFSKLRSPISREAKSILQDMKLRPEPTIFEVDQRPDAEVLVPLLHRLTNTTILPILLIGGTSVGTIEDIRDLDARGDLRKAVTAAGAEVGGANNRKKNRHR